MRIRLVLRHSREYDNTPPMAKNATAMISRKICALVGMAPDVKYLKDYPLHGDPERSGTPRSAGSHRIAGQHESSKESGAALRGVPLRSAPACPANLSRA